INRRSSRARQAAVVVFDVTLKPGVAIPSAKVVCLLGHLSAYESWLIATPYITRLTMVRTTLWLYRNWTPARPASSYFSVSRFAPHVLIAYLASADGGADERCWRKARTGHGAG